jgi:hypothetical protein
VGLRPIGRSLPEALARWESLISAPGGVRPDVKVVSTATSRMGI